MNFNGISILARRAVFGLLFGMIPAAIHANDTNHYLKKTGRIGLYAVQSVAGLYFVRESWRSFNNSRTSRFEDRINKHRIFTLVAGITTLVNGVSGLERELGIWKSITQAFRNK